MKQNRMTNEQVYELYWNRELCEEGRNFLIDRRLSIPIAEKNGIRSKNGRIYFFYTINGEPVFWKTRSMVDKKDQFTEVKTDEQKETFKMPFFSQFKDPRCSKLIVTEGEFDTVALRQLGAPNCISLPFGCRSVEKCFKENFEFLQMFDEIYIAFDMDESGENAALLASRLIDPAKYRRICFPCKDANQWIQEFEATKEDLESLMVNSKRLQTPYVTNIKDLPKEFYEEINLGILSGYSQLDAILGGLRPGELTIVSGDTGSGKSTFCMNLFKNIAEENNPIWINSFELDPRVINRKLASIVLGKKMKNREFTEEEKNDYLSWIKSKNVSLNIVNEKVDLKWLNKHFELISLVYGIKFVLIDHFDYIHSSLNKTTLENIDECIRELHILAMKYNVGVILVVHPKQSQESKKITMHDLKGSSSIKQYADNILIVTRMDRLDANDIGRVEIRIFKNRLLGVEKSFSLRYIEESDSYC
jgi:twinkle protein